MRIRTDYDDDPARFRLGAQITADHLRTCSLYAHISDLLTQAGSRHVLDMGCGDGALSKAMSQRVSDDTAPHHWEQRATRPRRRHDELRDPALITGSASSTKRPRLIGLDASITMARSHPAPVVLGDTTALPFRSSAFDAVAAVNMLYHLEDPLLAIHEAYRVLEPGGLFLAASPARNDSPELAHVWRRPPSTFDAEDAPALVASVFPQVEVDPWDAPLLALPDTETVRDYLIARQLSPAQATTAAARIATPLTLTKRGALVTARK